MGTMDTRATPYLYRDCELDLKDLAELYEVETHMDMRDDPSGTIKRRIVAPNIFENVLVVYRGESLPLSTLEFRNCIFRFVLQKRPSSAQGQQLLLAVITEDPRSIKIAPTS